MKASDIQVGQFYAVSTADRIQDKYASVTKVLVIEAPVVGWARQGYSSSWTVRGKVTTDPNAPKSYALVQPYVQNYGEPVDERTGKHPFTLPAFKGEQDRVRLRDIKMTWAEYEAQLAGMQNVKRQNDNADAQWEAQAAAINKRLEAFAGTELEDSQKVTRGWSGRQTLYGIHSGSYGRQATLDLLEALLDAATGKADLLEEL